MAFLIRLGWEFRGDSCGGRSGPGAGQLDSGDPPPPGCLDFSFLSAPVLPLVFSCLFGVSKQAGVGWEEISSLIPKISEGQRGLFAEEGGPLSCPQEEKCVPGSSA